MYGIMGFAPFVDLEWESRVAQWIVSSGAPLTFSKSAELDSISSSEPDYPNVHVPQDLQPAVGNVQ